MISKKDLIQIINACIIDTSETIGEMRGKRHPFPESVSRMEKRLMESRKFFINTRDRLIEEL